MIHGLPPGRRGTAGLDVRCRRGDYQSPASGGRRTGHGRQAARGCHPECGEGFLSTAEGIHRGSGFTGTGRGRLKKPAFSNEHLRGRLIIAPTLAGRLIIAPALAGRLIIAPTLAGRIVIAPTLAGRLIIAPTVKQQPPPVPRASKEGKYII